MNRDQRKEFFETKFAVEYTCANCPYCYTPPNRPFARICNISWKLLHPLRLGMKQDLCEHLQEQNKKENAK